MISVQLGVSLEEALVRLRAHAFAASTPLDDVAGDVVSRGCCGSTPSRSWHRQHGTMTVRAGGREGLL